MKAMNSRLPMGTPIAGSGRPVRAWAAGLVFALLAVLFGLSGAVLGWEIQLVVLSMIVPVVVLMSDYRLGLALMILVLPVATSPLLPRVGPLNALNLLIIGVVMVFVAQRILLALRSSRVPLPIPRTLLLYYLVPVTLATIIGCTHLDEITEFYLRKSQLERYGFKEYVISSYLKNTLLVVTALIMATSVIERKNARFIVVAACLSPLLFVLGMIAVMGGAGFSMEDLRNSRSFLAILGRHANEAGVLLMLQLGPMLFMRENVSNRLLKFLLTIACVMLAGGVLFTVSRGAILAMVAVLAYYVLYYRRVRTALAVVTIAAVGFALSPPQLQERVVMGTGDSSATASISDRDDRLTSGRVAIWGNLLPEVAKSPLFGRGMLSIQWSDYVRSGQFSANHPHNMYLEILMDMGVLGAICMFIFYRWAWRMFRDLSRDERLDKPMRGYFAGSIAMMIGHLAYGTSNGHYFSHSEQLYLWVAIGLAIGYTYLLRKMPPLPQKVAAPKPPPWARRAGIAPRVGP